MDYYLNITAKNFLETMFRHIKNAGEIKFPIDIENICTSTGIELCEFDGPNVTHEDAIKKKPGCVPPYGMTEMACYVAGKPHIYINRFMGERFRRYSIGHGLFHLLRCGLEEKGESSFLEGKDAWITGEEMLANSFANGLLMPQPALEHMAGYLTIPELVETFQVPLHRLLARIFCVLDRCAICALYFNEKPFVFCLKPVMGKTGKSPETLNFSEVVRQLRRDRNYAAFIVDHEINFFPATIIESGGQLDELEALRANSPGKPGEIFADYIGFEPFRGWDVYGRDFELIEAEYFCHSFSFVEDDYLSAKKVKYDVVICIEDHRKELLNMWVYGGQYPLIPPSCLYAKRFVSSPNPDEFAKELLDSRINLKHWQDMLIKLINQPSPFDDYDSKGEDHD